MEFIYRISYILVFFLSLGATAGAFLVSKRLKDSYNKAAFESIFYYVILMALFGIYGIWGHVLIITVLKKLDISSGIINTVAQLIPLMGFPFLMVGNYMLILTGYQLSDQRIKKIVPVLYFIIYIILLSWLAWVSFDFEQGENLMVVFPTSILIYFYIFQDIIVSIWYIVILFYTIRRRSVFSARSASLRYLSIFIFLLILKSAYVFNLFALWEYNSVFILIYFLGFSIPTVYLYIRSDRILYELNPEWGTQSSWDLYLKKEGVTRREREVIDLICQGKSNQEIADILFISLQTVKDHTHRIYLKVEVKSRVQLIGKFQKMG